MSRKMIDYQVDGGNISSIDGYTVGDKITGAKLKENIAKSTPDDGMSYTLTNDGTGRLVINAKGRYEYKSGTFSYNFTAPAGNYVLGQTILINSRVQVNWGYVIGAASGYETSYPLPTQERIPTEPIWEIEALPNDNGSLYVYAKCIKEGTLTVEKDYGTIYIRYVYLFDGNYR